MEFRTLAESVLTGLGNRQIAALYHIAESNGCRLTADYGNAANLLWLVFFLCEFGYGENSGHEVIDLNLTAVFGLYGLLNTVALYMA